MDGETARARAILQALSRELADRLDDEEDEGEAVATVSAEQAVVSGAARARLVRFLEAFATAYGAECPDARRAAYGSCRVCGARDCRRWTDHVSLDYGHAFALAVREQRRGWERGVFPGRQLQPALAA